MHNKTGQHTVDLKKTPKHQIHTPMQKQPAQSINAQPLPKQAAQKEQAPQQTPPTQPIQKIPVQQEPKKQYSGFQFTNEWSAINSYARARTKNWYAVFILTTGALMTYSILMKDWLFLVFIAIGAGFVYLKGHIQPKLFHYGLTQQGIVVNNRLYPYNHLESFWIHQPFHGYNELVVTSKKTSMTELRIPLGNEDPEKIHDSIAEHLPLEDDPEESLADILHRVVGI